MIVREPGFENGVLGVPHGFDLGGIGPPQSVESRERDVLVGVNGTNNFGIGLGIKGIETGFGVLGG